MPWSRRVVGYAISRSVDARLTLAALESSHLWTIAVAPNGFCRTRGSAA
jgi:hypothetical protein